MTTNTTNDTNSVTDTQQYKTFLEMLQSFPDDLLAAIQYVFDKFFSSNPDKTGATNEDVKSDTQTTQQSVSYTINTLPDINVSLKFPPFKKEEVLLPYDNSYGSTQYDDKQTVAELVQAFLGSNRVLQTYPVGSIVFSLFSLSEGDIDIFTYRGYKLVPLGNTTTTTISSQFTQQLKNAYNFGTEALVITAPSMRNKTLYFDASNTAKSRYTNSDMTKNQQVGEDTAVPLTYTGKSDQRHFTSTTRDTPGDTTINSPNPRYIDQSTDSAATVNVDVRDKSVILFFYMIIEIEIS